MLVLFLFVCRKELLLLTTSHFVFYLFICFIFIYFSDEKLHFSHQVLFELAFFLIVQFVYIHNNFPTNQRPPPPLFILFIISLFNIHKMYIFLYSFVIPYIISTLSDYTIVPILHIPTLLPIYLLYLFLP